MIRSTSGSGSWLVPLADLRRTAHELPPEIAMSAPLAVPSIRATLRGDLADRVAEATAHELVEQVRLRATEHFAEGAQPMAERRDPNFAGR